MFFFATLRPVSSTFSYAEPNGAALPLCLVCALGSIFSFFNLCVFFLDASFLFSA